MTAALGNRRPSEKDSQKDFRIGFVLLSKDGKKASASSVQKANEFASEIEQLFRRETRNLGSIDTGL